MTEFLSRSGFFPADFCGEHRTSAGALNAQDVLFLKGKQPASLVQAEVLSGESAFSRLATAGLDPARICVYGHQQDKWESEAASFFPSAHLCGAEALQSQPGSLKKSKASDDVFVFEAYGPQPSLPEAFAQIITPGSAVVVRTQVGADGGAESLCFLSIARQLAKCDLHLFDIGFRSRHSESSFLRWADFVFVDRDNPKSPLHEVWPTYLYNEPRLKMFAPSITDLRRAASRLKQRLLASRKPIG
jgi:hypothetical protein